MAAGPLYAVTVDVEEEWDWAAGFPAGPASVTNVAALPRLQSVVDAAAASVTYFVNHAVLTTPSALAVVRDLAGRPNAEIGLHIHPWNTPPLGPGPSVTRRESFLHNLPWDEARAKLDSVFAAFAAAGLPPPTSYRGGRYSTSDRIRDYLRDRGVIADASCVPYTTWADDGAPDYRGRTPEPVRHPPRRPGDAACWEVPLSLTWTRGPGGLWARGPAWERAARLARAYKVWLNAENPLGQDLGPAVPYFAGFPFLSFTMHSSSLIAGGSPYTRTAADADKHLANLRAGLDAAAALGGRPATVSDIARTLEAAA